MDKLTTFVGLDQHKKRITVAVALGDGEPFGAGTIANQPEAIARLVEKWGAEGTIYAYEAGPCGYGLYRQLVSLGTRCIVVAPSRIPKAPGERVKTDRRDALKLAVLLRAGSLPAVWVPDVEQEALRDLTRARQSAQQDLQRVRNRLTKLLLHLDVRPPAEVKSWTVAYRRWLQELQLPRPLQQSVLAELRQALEEAEARARRLRHLVQEAAKLSRWAPLIQALQTLRGIGVITAITLVAEMGDPSRFQTAPRLMGYGGLIPSEYSTGNRVRRGHITRTGNAHIRHVLGEAAWVAARSLQAGKVLRQQRAGQPEAILAIATRADERLHRRYYRLIHRGKPSQQAATAVARELLGFVWAIARTVAGLPVPPPRHAHAAAA